MDNPTPLTPEERKALHDFRERFKDGVKRKRGWTLGAMRQDYISFHDLAKRRKATDVGGSKLTWPEDERMLLEIYWTVYDEQQKLLNKIKGDCPIGWFKPSWEQAQVLNTWHPDYDPEMPKGYRSMCDFSSVRVGKTTALIINIGLWLGPYNKDWVVYEPYIDHLGRLVQVFPRFDWDEWNRSERRVFTDDPPKSACVNWVGCVNENHFIQKLDPAFRKWIPDSWIGRKGRSGKDQEWYRAERLFKTRWGTSVVFKLYESEMSDWSGEALHQASFDEGPPKDKLDEVVVRSEYIHIAFTPREAANLGGRSALAHKIWKGDDVDKGGQPLIGKKKFFFSKMADAPDHILSKETRERRLLVASKMGEAGKVAVEGGFFQSSPIVFSNFERARNVLPIGGAELLKRYPDAMLIRGMDEGLANPTACTWYIVTPQNEWVAFQSWEQAGLSVGDRCDKIIMLSRNERTIFKWNEDETRRIYRESMKGMRIRRTFADSKLFKRNPEKVEDNWATTYWNAGLRIERASNIGPAARCDFLNDMMRTEVTRKHILFGDPVHGATEAANGPGSRWYVSIDCDKIIERCENYLWQQISTGARMGEFTDKPATGDDHTIDSFCYPPISGLRWRPWTDNDAHTVRPSGHAGRSLVTGY